MGNNILKVQGLTALDYIKFTTFWGPIGGSVESHARAKCKGKIFLDKELCLIKQIS
jgi:hypothetical protein